MNREINKYINPSMNQAIDRWINDRSIDQSSIDRFIDGLLYRLIDYILVPPLLRNSLT